MRRAFILGAVVGALVFYSGLFDTSWSIRAFYIVGAVGARAGWGIRTDVGFYATRMAVSAHRRHRSSLLLRRCRRDHIPRVLVAPNARCRRRRHSSYYSSRSPISLGCSVGSCVALALHRRVPGKNLPPTRVMALAADRVVVLQEQRGQAPGRASRPPRARPLPDVLRSTGTAS